MAINPTVTPNSLASGLHSGQVPSVPQAVPVVAIAYARCSTEEQSAESLSIDYQAAKLEAYVGVGNVIKDERSATKTPLEKRDAFWKAIDRLRRAPKSAERILYYTRMDRIARLSEDFEVIDRLAKEGIIFKGLDSGQVDLSNATGRMIARFGLTISQYEQELLGEKLEGKYRERRASHSAMNRPPFGFKLKKTINEQSVTYRWVPHPEQWIQAKQIVKEFIAQEGNLNGTLAAIKYEGMPRSARGLKLWLSNNALLGHTEYQPTTTRVGNRVVEHQIIENTHRALITAEERVVIDRLLSTRSKPGRPKESFREPHPLTGVLRCPCCSRAVTFTTKIYVAKGNGIGRYAGKYKSGEKKLMHAAGCRYTSQGRCDLKDTSVFGKQSLDAIERAAWMHLEEHRQNHHISTGNSSGDDRSDEVTIQNEINRLKLLNIPAMKPAIQEMENQLEQLRFKHQGQVENRDRTLRSLASLDLNPDVIMQLSLTERNTLLRQFFHQIIPPFGDRGIVFDIDG